MIELLIAGAVLLLVAPGAILYKVTVTNTLARKRLEAKIYNAEAERDYLKKQIGKYERVENAPFRAQVPKKIPVVINPPGSDVFPATKPPSLATITKEDEEMSLLGRFFEQWANDMQDTFKNSDGFTSFAVPTSRICNQFIDCLNEVRATIHDEPGYNRTRVVVPRKYANDMKWMRTPRAPRAPKAPTLPKLRGLIHKP